METNVRTPLEVFNLPQWLQIPLFQRPYVWNEDDQWLPLWKDVQRLADLRVSEEHPEARHFLGAVVVQAHPQKFGALVVHNIIDGQQRLTTLQLLADAAGAVLEEAELDHLSAQLEDLTHNSDKYVPEGESHLKLRHLNRDRAAYDEVMSAEPPIDYDGLAHSGSLVARAHRFFYDAVGAWVVEGGEDSVSVRGQALVEVLTTGVQLVAINLSEAENSQEIFETLNARGTPLTAADLIKNLVFQKLDAEGADTMRAYAQGWPFESAFWESEVSAGRHKLSRSSLFFNQWLTARTGEEVSPLSTFNRFKAFVDHEAGKPVTELLGEIKSEADRYERWIESSKDASKQLSVVEMNVYRMRSSGIEVLMPLLIWLHSPGKVLPQSEIDAVVGAAESWVLRRQIVRLTSGDLGRNVAELIRDNRDVPVEQVANRVIGQLTRRNVTSNYWPGDEEVRAALETEPVYRRLKAGRVRILLEAVENKLRSETAQPQVLRAGYPVEHILPQAWEENWPVEGEQAQIERAARVHRLGNLTLVTTKLNSKVSNNAWSAKREEMANHDTFLINSRYLQADGILKEQWDEASIDARTSALANDLLEVWPVPDGHIGEVVDPVAKSNGWVMIKHLVDANSVEPGTELRGKSGAWGDPVAQITEEGLIAVGELTFETPSGAAKHVKKVSSSNGWKFWSLPDGRTLAEVRREFNGESPSEADSGFDWSVLHEILERFPAGRWTTYGDLSDAIGTASQPLGRHVAKCEHCANAYRILRSDGKISNDFAWTQKGDSRDPREVLEAEGVGFIDGIADPDRRVSSEDLASLTGLAVTE